MSKKKKDIKEDKFVVANVATDQAEQLWSQQSVPKGVIEGVIGMSLTEIFKSFGALRGDYGEGKKLKKFGVKNTKATLLIAVDEINNIWVVTRPMGDSTLNPKHRYAKYRSLKFLQDYEKTQGDIKSARYKSSPALINGLKLVTDTIADIGEVMRQKDNKLALEELQAMSQFVKENRGGNNR